jgi:glucose/arabinose dehydrogenase
VDRRRSREQLSRFDLDRFRVRFPLLLRNVGLVALVLCLASCQSVQPSSALAQGEAASGAKTPLPGHCAPRLGTDLVLRPIVRGLTRPVELTAPRADPRLFVAEQGGRVFVVKDGEVLPDPFVDLTSRLTSRSNEQGLLGLAFHPDFPRDPRVFVNYSEKGSGATVVAALSVDPAQPDRVLPGERRLLRIEQPYANHNGGGLAFGPKDGFLYIGVGDGGAGGDPRGYGQNSASLLGTLLRVDVSRDPADPKFSPETNPTEALAVWGGKPAPPVWAMGLRNPWRFSFDPDNGDLYIGDVGQNAVEEINWVSGDSSGGENYGWKVREGDACFSKVEGSCALAGSTDPVFVVPARRPCNSITGGHVYRGACLPDLVGRYVFGDYCHNTVLSFVMEQGAARQFKDFTAQLDPSGNLLDGVASFGTDGFGELYVVSHQNGVVYRLEARP